jgi:chromosome segregation ATPase
MSVTNEIGIPKRDEFDDPRSARQRFKDQAAELRRQLEQHEITEEAYEERMNELLQAEEDFERARQLEHEQPPGELEDVFPDNEVEPASGLLPR